MAKVKKVKKTKEEKIAIYKSARKARRERERTQAKRDQDVILAARRLATKLVNEIENGTVQFKEGLEWSISEGYPTELATLCEALDEQDSEGAFNPFIPIIVLEPLTGATWTVKEASDAVGISPKTLREWLRLEGFQKTGKNWIISETDMLKINQRWPQPPPVMGAV